MVPEAALKKKKLRKKCRRQEKRRMTFHAPLYVTVAKKCGAGTPYYYNHYNVVCSGFGTKIISCLRQLFWQRRKEREEQNSFFFFHGCWHYKRLMMHFAQLQPNYKWNSKAKKTIEAWDFANRARAMRIYVPYSFQVEAEEVPWPKGG